VDLGAPVDRIGFIPPSIDLQLLQEVSRHTGSRPVVRFLNVARCIEGKGQVFLIQALPDSLEMACARVSISLVRAPYCRSSNPRPTA
jgi:hypothetical protein